MMDTRTTDNSRRVIASILNNRPEPYQVISHEFVGFGQARTASLEAVWRHYPHATHVLLADPDWRPDVSTMQKVNLVEPFDVYRFTAIDRNGSSRRQIDWILRNRPGLRMRYHLHEELDIGEYTVTSIPFVVNEIEKPGMWYSLFGNGNSLGFGIEIGLERYLLDLEMLQMDLSAYGHNPHTHYYLGVTHAAVVEKEGANIMAGKRSLNVDYVHHLTEAIKYLELRATSSYDDEFVDERWAAMYLMGSIYTTYKRDTNKAEYWLSMCRDFDRDNIECSMNLVRLHLKLGMLAKAVQELENALRRNYTPRDFMGNSHRWDCDLPALALSTLTHILTAKAEMYGQYVGKASTSGSNSPEALFKEGKNIALYVLMLKEMQERPQCIAANKQPYDMTSAAQEAIELFIPKRGSTNSYNPSLRELCDNVALRAYLNQTRYKLHACDRLQMDIDDTERCADLQVDMLPPSMEFHARAYNEFLGAGSIPDVVHHAYKGNAQLLYAKRINILFAEYFNIRNFYNLVGFFLRNKSFRGDITVVTQDINLANQAQEVLESCIFRQEGTYTISYKIIRLTDYLFRVSEENAKLSSMYQTKFDYIEYNSGLSTSTEATTHLTFFSEILAPNGVLGLTYFGANHHQQTIRSLVKNRNSSAHHPFSQQAERIVEAYLCANQMCDLTNDDELVQFLAGISPDVEMKDTFAAFHRHEVEGILFSYGLKEVSWLPATYSHPYSELQQASVQKYKSIGVSEEAFAYTIMPNFRYTVYATSAASDLPGRARGTKEFLEAEMKHVRVTGRVGEYSEAFKGKHAYMLFSSCF
jgi:hypothetical protein